MHVCNNLDIIRIFKTLKLQHL